MYNKEAVEETLDVIRELYEDYNIVMSNIVGSHMYGLDTQESKIELLCCYTVPTKRLFSLKKPEKIGDYDTKYVHLISYEVEEYINNLIKPNLNHIEMTKSPIKICGSKDSKMLVKIADKCISTEIIPIMFGKSGNLLEICKKSDFTKAKDHLNLIREILKNIILLETGELVSDIYDIIKIYNLRIMNEDYYSSIVDELIDMKGTKTILTKKQAHLISSCIIPQLQLDMKNAKNNNILEEMDPNIKDDASDILVKIREDNYLFE